MEILDRALLFCLENDTPSFANLKDTYAYFKREEERLKTIQKGKKTPVLLYQGEHSPFKVSQRSLAVYQEIIKKREGAVI